MLSTDAPCEFVIDSYPSAFNSSCHRGIRTRLQEVSPIDDKLMRKETSYDPAVMTASNTARKMRWERLGAETKSEIDVDSAKCFMADHYDESLMTPGACLRALCGHGETDAVGIPDAGWGPYSPVGAAQGKVTSAALAADLKMWARMGHPCGTDFFAGPFLSKHPEYLWQKPFLLDMKSHPWAQFAATNMSVHHASLSPLR